MNWIITSVLPAWMWSADTRWNQQREKNSADPSSLSYNRSRLLQHNSVHVRGSTLYHRHDASQGNLFQGQSPQLHVGVMEKANYSYNRIISFLRTLRHITDLPAFCPHRFPDICWLPAPADCDITAAFFSALRGCQYKILQQLTEPKFLTMNIQSALRKIMMPWND